ncbi:MAG: ADOP family duplicated permease [Opitutales bacterium]
MNPLRQLLFRLQLPFRRRQIEQGLSEEIRVHLEMATAANLAAGMSPEEARAAALRQFGGVAQMQEAYRDERGLPWLEQLLQDLRYAARSLGKSPGFTATAILTLVLGIGVNTTTFSFVNAVVFQPLPYAEPHDLVSVYRTSAHGPSDAHSPGDIMDVKAQNDVFAKFAIIDLPTFSLAVPGQPAERVNAFAVSGDYFAMLGVPPMLGRVFGPAEDRPGHNQVIVLSYQYWMRRFAGEPGIVGRTLRLDGEPVTVIGVMPEQFDTPMVLGSREIWKPLAMNAGLAKVRDGYWLQAVARLKPGVSLAQAQANLNTIAARLSHDYPLTDAQCGFYPARLDRDNSGQFFWMLMGLAAAVLLIACANLANLQLARSSGRTREYAVRVALGASRSRLLRQMLTESLALALLGGAGGVLAAWGTNQMLASRLGDLIGNPSLRISIDARVLGFALLAALATGLLFGIAPAWFTSRVDPNTGLKQAGSGLTGDRSRHRLRQALVVAELSLTLVLLAGAGYFIHGVHRVMQRETGWRTDHLLSGRFALPASRYGDLEKCRSFYDRLNVELAAAPGVERSVTCDVLPLGGFYNSRGVVAEGATPVGAGQESLTFVNTATPGYFATLGMKILQGRDFTAADRPGAPAVVIIDDALARQFWPNENPLGKRIGSTDPAKRDWLEVVGVVNEVSFKFNPEPTSHLQVYRPMAQTGGNYFAVVARTSVAPESLVEALRQAVRRVDPDQAVYNISSVDQMLEGFSNSGRVLTNGLLVMAVSGLLLSTLGLYGVIAHLVLERTREIGIRVALGARVSEVVWLVLGQGVRLAALGVVLGMAGAWALARLFGSFMPGMLGQDPLVVAACSVLLFGVALLACWLPAQRAAKVDPITALRAE